MAILKMHIKTGDNVLVISGKDKGKKGKVLAVMPDKRMVIVEGISMASKHKRPRKQGEQGGIIKQETPLHACKVMNICGKCNEASRVGRKVLGDGAHVRFCKKCGEIFGK
jgi:large subunit ribosomal protein L24